MTNLGYKLIFLKLIVLTFLLPASGHSQETITLNGTLTDAQSGEFLIGANVYVSSINIGSTSNTYGFYSLTVPKKDSTYVSFSYLGYEPHIKKVFTETDLRVNIELYPSSQSIGEIVISSERNDKNISGTQMGEINVPIINIKELPVILGEPDILKTIQLLPGVKSGNEGTTGYFVRGGNADQNLVQLDEAIIYNPNHLLGFVSSINARAINNVKLIKGGFPSQYGGRLSSILDISLKEGNKKHFAGEGGIGLISSQLTLEGPIRKDKSSFIVSGRRTYFDYLFKPFLSKNSKTNYVFYDTNAKFNYKLGESDRIYFSGYLSRDKAFYAQDAIEYDLLIDNKAATFRWNHIFSPKLFANTSIIASAFKQNISAFQDNAFSAVNSGINDISSKFELQYFPNQSQKILFGFHFSNHTFTSKGNSELFSGTNPEQPLPSDSIAEKKFNELAIYINDEIKFSDNFSTNIGIRFPGFYNSDVRYFKFEPRIALKYGLTHSSSLKVAFTLMNQFIHLVPSTAAALPTEIWIPVSAATRPQTSKQFSLGFFKNFKENKLESSLELYYKTMDNQILFREGNQFLGSLDVDDLLVYGEGWSYGGEFFLKKNAGKLSGWISYTLSWTDRKFPDLNFGEKFPFRFDKRHDFSIAASYEYSDKWTFSASFVYATGSAYTVPVGRIPVANGATLFEGNYYIYENRNNARLNAYHRLNLSAIYKKERTIFGKKYQSEWVFSLYNAYSRQNPYFVFFDIDPITERPRAKQVSLLPILPSVTYNFKF